MVAALVGVSLIFVLTPQTNLPLRNCLIIFLLLAGTLVNAQSTPDYTPLAERLARYARLSMDWKIDSLLDLTDPQLFEIVPREAVWKQLTGFMSDENMSVIVKNFTIDEIGEIVGHHQDAYAPVKCHHQFEFHLESAEYREPAAQQRIVRMLRKRYGTENVRVSTPDHLIYVHVEKSMFAIRRGAAAQWYFVEYRPENAALLDLLLPPPVRSLVGLE